MDDKRYADISARVMESYPNACICFIDEVHNPSALAAYESCKQTCPDAKEVQAFHGTHASLVDRIAKYGFDPSKNVVAAYGYGTYFAYNAQYSYFYMKSADKDGLSYMFLADVLVGVGAANTIAQNTIYVAPLSEQTYPRYIIGFHKSAK
jgi:hypothetical protein